MNAGSLLLPALWSFDMNVADDWGKVPQVLRTRDYFSRMETLDGQFIRQYKIPSFHPKLRPARELRLTTFETACQKALENNIHLDDHTWQTIFGLCQDLAFKKFNLIQEPVLSSDQPQLLALVLEGFK